MFFSLGGQGGLKIVGVIGLLLAVIDRLEQQDEQCILFFDGNVINMCLDIKKVIVDCWHFDSLTSKLLHLQWICR